MNIVTVTARLLLLIVLFSIYGCGNKGSESTQAGQPFLYPFKENGKWGYVDAAGKVVVAATYDHCWDFHDSMGRVKLAGRYGFVNADGELSIKATYAYASDFQDGFAKVNTKDTIITDATYDGYDLTSDWTLINKKGIIFPETFARIEFVRKGLIQVKDDPAYDSPWSYATVSEGSLTREDHNTEAIFTFNGHDLAPASDPSTGKIGMINKKEEWIIQPSFDAIEPFSENLAAAKQGNVYGYIDKRGVWVYQKVASEKQYYSLSDFKAFSNGLAAVRTDDDAYGYIDQSGKVVSKQRFKSVGSYSADGYAIVSTDAGTGLINKSGDFVIKPHLDIAAVQEGLVIYRQNDRYGVKELSTLADVVPAEYDNIEFASGLIRVVKKGATFGFVDNKGNYTIKPQYESAWPFRSGKAIIQLNGKYVYIDRSGKNVGEVPEKEQPYYYENTSAIYAWDEGGKFGFKVSGQDKMMIPATYDFATDFEGKIARVNVGATLNDESYYYEGGKWGLVNERNEALLPSTYELILPFKEGVAMFNVGGEATYQLCEAECEEAVYYTCSGGKWGLLQDNGTTITAASFDRIIPFGKNFLAQEGPNYVILDRQGKPILTTPFQLTYLSGEELEAGLIMDFSSYNFIKADVNKKYGILSNEGKWIIEPGYDDLTAAEETNADPFIEGAVIGKIQALWGAFDANGKILIPPSYEEMRPFASGMAAVKMNDKWGFINVDNQLTVPHQYFNVRDFQGNVAIVQPQENGLEEVINKDANTIFRAEPGVTLDYNGFVKGLCIINASEQSEGAAYPSYTCGVINDKGKILFGKRALAEARIQNNGNLLYVIKDGKWAMATADGAMLTGFNYSWIEPYVGQELIRINVNGEVFMGEMGGEEEAYGGQWGFIEKTGKTRVEPVFTELGSFSEGLAPARTAADLDEIGYFDRKGDVVLPMKR